MPMMVMKRNFRLATIKGHSVMFEKDVPVSVPPDIVADAVAVGAVPAEGDVDVTPVPPPKPNTGPAEAALREQQIIAAMADLVATNDREDFAGSGIPKHAAVGLKVGYKVSKQEVDAAWLKRAELIAAGLLGVDGRAV